MTPEDLFRLVDVTGVVANGLLGAMVARKLDYDVIGYLALGIVTALGGGIVRDLMLNQGFPVALTDPWYLTGAILAALVSYFVPLEGKFSRRILNVADALALGCWSATGAAKALSAGLNVIPAIFLGVITATLGGVFRDVMAQQRPLIFGHNPLYATLSIIAAGQMVLFQKLGLYESGMGFAILICVIFYFLSRKFNWQLPAGGVDLTHAARSRMPGITRRRPSNPNQDG